MKSYSLRTVSELDRTRLAVLQFPLLFRGRLIQYYIHTLFWGLLVIQLAK